MSGIFIQQSKMKLFELSEKLKYFVTLIDPTGKADQHIGVFPNLKMAHQGILQHATKVGIIPNVVKVSDMQDITQVGNIWEVGSDEVSYLIKIGDWPSSADYS